MLCYGYGCAAAGECQWYKVYAVIGMGALLQGHASGTRYAVTFMDAGCAAAGAWQWYKVPCHDNAIGSGCAAAGASSGTRYAAMTAMRLLLDCYWRAAEVTGWFLLRPEIWSSWLRSGSAGYEIVKQYDK